MVEGMLTAYKFGTYVPHEDFNRGTLFVVYLAIIGFAFAASTLIVKTFEK